MNNNVGIYDAKIGRYRKNESKHALKGVADILGVLPDGRFLAIEVKKKGGYPTIEQKAFLLNVQERGGVALLVRSIKELDEGMLKHVPTWTKSVF